MSSKRLAMSRYSSAFCFEGLIAMVRPHVKRLHVECVEHTRVKGVADLESGQVPPGRPITKEPRTEARGSRRPTMRVRGWGARRPSASSTSDGRIRSGEKTRRAECAKRHPPIVGPTADDAFRLIRPYVLQSSALR